MTGKLSTALRTVLAVTASASVLACGGPSDVGTDTSTSAVKTITNAWVFAKTPPARTNIPVVAPVQSLEMLAFTLDVTGYRDTRVTGMAFQVMGTIPAGTLANYQLVWFADGLKKPATVLGTNDGTTWVPGSSPMIVIPVAAPITLPKNFKGQFALLVDVNGGAGTFVTAQLQTVTMDQGAGDVNVTDTCTLPLAGDTFYVQ